MYLKTTIAIMALSAGLAAPSALAQRPPIEAGEPGQLVTRQPVARPKAHTPKVCGQRTLQVRARCLASGA